MDVDVDVAAAGSEAAVAVSAAAGGAGSFAAAAAAAPVWRPLGPMPRKGDALCAWLALAGVRPDVVKLIVTAIELACSIIAGVAVVGAGASSAAAPGRR